MTFSIVARAGAEWGVAVASKFLAVGAVVPAAAAGVGAIATQAYANLGYRPDGLALLRAGRSAEEVVALLTAADDGREQRQLGVVDAAGRAATFTGGGCHDWAGGRTGDGYAVQGNLLAGPDVPAAMERAFRAAEGSLAHRLLAALTAGDAAGGDRRGRQSAALLVASPGAGYGGTSDIAVDLRVDDHPDPVAELARLLELHELYFGRPDPATLLAFDAGLVSELTGLLTDVGQPPTGADPVAVRAALAAWAGVANVEERLHPGGLDPLVLRLLRDQAAGAA